MRFNLRILLTAFILISGVMFLATRPFSHRQRMIANGIRAAKEHWPTCAMIYEMPLQTPDSSTGIFISSYVDRESGLTIVSGGQSPFHGAYNGEIARLISINGPPEYSLVDVLPTKSEIHRMFTAGKMGLIDRFPHAIGTSIELKTRYPLQIETTGPSFKSVSSSDRDLPVYVCKRDSLVYIRHGEQWMGVYLSNGKLLFEVHVFK